MPQIARPPDAPDGQCPVCDEPYYDKRIACTYTSTAPLSDVNDFCSKAGRSHYRTIYFIHEQPTVGGNDD